MAFIKTLLDNSEKSSAKIKEKRSETFWFISVKCKKVKYPKSNKESFNKNVHVI
jgi:hypothetical protein